MAERPHQFREMYSAKEHSIILPAVSSENREYIPLGYFNSETVVTNRNFAIYDSKSFIFSVLTSGMHMTWVRAVAGRLETRFNYSSTICYNTFPFPSISETQKQELEKHAYRILEEREKHSEKTYLSSTLSNGSYFFSVSMLPK